MDLITFLLINAVAYWLIVLCDQVLKDGYAKGARILIACVVLFLLALSRLPGSFR